MMTRIKSTPGEIIKHEFLDPRGITQNSLAFAMDINPGIVSRIIAGKTKITPEMALRLSVVFKTTPQFWLNLQADHDLSVLKANKEFMEKINKLDNINKD